MRILPCLLILSLPIPAWSQPVLRITDARQPNPVAPYVYFLEDFTHKLTYEQVSRFPLDSFQALNQNAYIQLSYRRGTIWMRFAMKNQTDCELLLISTSRRIQRMDLFVRNEAGQLRIHRLGSERPLANRYTPTARITTLLGRHPSMIYISITNIDAINDYLHIADASYAIAYSKQLSFGQGIVLGVYLLALLLALIFFLRFRDSLVGWYALLVLSNILFYVNFFGYVYEWMDNFYYTNTQFIIPINFLYLTCWNVFHIKFLRLKHHSKGLYRLTVASLGLFMLDYLGSVAIMVKTGNYFSLLQPVWTALGIDRGGYFVYLLMLMVVCMVYVGSKNFRSLWVYTIAFSIGASSMVVSLLALYNIHWLPFTFNYAFIIGSLIEMLLLAYALTKQIRRQQAQTQNQLIAQLQENLKQKNKLLQIRDEIARDLHDEVGATLTSIAISTKLVRKKVGPEQTEITPILEQIQTDSEDTIHTIRDTVWALNPDNDAPEKLLERMRIVGFQVLANQTIDYAFESNLTPNELPPFSMEQRRNIYFVFKEALHNIVKHAQATSVNVLISRQVDQLRIRISDNGQGFEPTQTNDGNGLKNFQKRGSEGGFLVTVCSEVGRGSTVEIKLPLVQTTKIGDGVGY